LAVDVAVCSGLLALSGTSVSPFYLYSLSPLFGSGLFFQIRGGLLAATGMGLVYTASAVGTSILIESFPDFPLMAIHIAGFFLIASVFFEFGILAKQEEVPSKHVDNSLKAVYSPFCEQNVETRK
jgi:hypothetical protein